MSRILYLIHSLAFGGAERQLVELVGGILSEGGIEPHVCYFHESDTGYSSQLRNSGIPLNRISSRALLYSDLPLKVHRYVRKHEIHLIHSFSILAGLVACFAGKLSRVPVVASTIRNAGDPDLQSVISTRIQARLADCFVANSHAGFRNRFKAYRDNFRVVYNGVDLRRFDVNSEDTERVKARYHIGDRDNVVTMVASLSKFKDYDTFIRAMPEVLARCPQTRFLIVGDGTEKKRLEQLVYASGVSDGVVFTGYTHKVNAILAASDVSVLMTNEKCHQEGISNSILESMGMGLPVIATDGGGTGEVIEQGRNGYLIPPHDYRALASGLVKLLEDSNLRAEMGCHGRIILEKRFGLERYVSDYVGIYREFLERI